MSFIHNNPEYIMNWKLINEDMPPITPKGKFSFYGHGYGYLMVNNAIEGLLYPINRKAIPVYL